MLVRVTPAILAFVLLGAHFLRASQYHLLLLCVVGPLLLLKIRRRWGLVLLQILAYSGGIEWIRTIIVIAQRRISYGLPWIRMAVILGAVALFTVFSGLLLNSRQVKEKYEEK